MRQMMMQWRETHYWNFVQGIHWSPEDSPHEGSVIRILDVFYIASLNKPLKKSVELPVIWEDISLMYRHCHNGISPKLGYKIKC